MVKLPSRFLALYDSDHTVGYRLGLSWHTQFADVNSQLMQLNSTWLSRVSLFAPQEVKTKISVIIGSSVSENVISESFCNKKYTLQ